jgi:hypothetical protein
MSTPLKLSDQELDQILRSAEPLPVADHDRFLQTIAARLAGTTSGPGAVFRVCAEVQREFLRGNYPELGSGSWSKYG